MRFQPLVVGRPSKAVPVIERPQRRPRKAVVLRLGSISLFFVAAILVSAAIGQVRLGPKGPVPAAPKTSGDSASPGQGQSSPSGLRDTNPKSGGVRLGPKGPYTPAPRETTQAQATASPGSVKPPAPPLDPNKPETFQITITPAAEPELPLQYALLPKYEDVQPGNSVPFYYRAVLKWKDRPKEGTRPFHDNYDRWMDASPSTFPAREVREFLKRYRGLFAELQTAAHREQTEWSWRLKDLKGTDAIAFLLPELQESRQLGRLLYLKARLEIAERRYDDAIKTLQIGYKLCRDVAEPPTLINDLVGIAVASMMTAQVREIIGSPNSPNLYWALSKLPRPFIDMEPALRYEVSIPMKLFPAMKDAETAEHSPEEWSRLLAQAFAFALESSGASRMRGNRMLQARLGIAGLAMKGYPRAKRDLVAWGFDPKRVDAMPVGQVIAIHQARIYRYMYQEMMKWSNLPYHQALVGLRKSERKLKDEGYLAPAGTGREIIPLAALLLPAVWQAQKASARLDSRITGLQVLEAIRMYAAGHNGKLPDSLADIRDVPVPVNPVTGQPYPYHFAADKAVLEIPAAPGDPARVGWRFEITVRK